MQQFWSKLKKEILRSTGKNKLNKEEWERRKKLIFYKLKTSSKYRNTFFTRTKKTDIGSLPKNFAPYYVPKKG